MTQQNASPERFLETFHDSNPGITSRAISNLAVLKAGQLFSSSYECLANEIPETDSSRILLDLACGDGYLLSLFTERKQLTLLGVDMSRGELEAASRRLGSAAILQQGKAQSLPFPNASVDYVVSHMALMLMDEVEQVLSEVHRVLKQDGSFAAIVGARPPSSPVFDAYLDLLSQYPRKEGLGGIRFGDRRIRTEVGIKQLFSKDFKNVVVKEALAKRRYTPSELCLWLQDSYDFHMLDVANQKDLNIKFVTSIENHCGSDGKVEFINLLYLITAVVA